MSNAPVIMFRPRAWNMLEVNMMVRTTEFPIKTETHETSVILLLVMVLSTLYKETDMLLI